MGVALQEALDTFSTLPHVQGDHAKRSWGHLYHSLCSYQGKLKPSLAHFLVKLFTAPGETVLDPLGGVGTVALEARIQGRTPITNDLNPLAYTIATAKVEQVISEQVWAVVEDLRRAVSELPLATDDFASADFGLNAKVRDYYHPDTLTQVLRARKFFLSENASDPNVNFVKSHVLHLLHGNRPYAISRTSHPITPFNPSGPFVRRDLMPGLESRISRFLDANDFPTGGVSLHVDATSDLAVAPVDAIITSVPFIGMRFDRPNWLRLWFCGWSAEDFHATKERFLERRQNSSLSVYLNVLQHWRTLLRDGGRLVLHCGVSSRVDMTAIFLKLLREEGYNVVGVVSEATTLESHGLTDKGLTRKQDVIVAEKP